jgi:hypothetical protein
MKNYSIHFSVIGRGEFPVDMLRHDCAFPADTSSAFRILTPNTRDEWRADREVHLRIRARALSAASAELAVTVDRWRSFGWSAQVESVEEV